MGLLVVGDRPDRLDTRTRGGEGRGEHRRVRLVDLAGPELLARPAQLRPGAEDGDARPPGAADRRQPDGGQRADLGGAEPGARGEQRIAGTNVAAGGPHVRAELRPALAISIVVVTYDNVLDRNDAVGALGHGAAGRDLHRLPGLRAGAAAGTPGGDPRDDGKPAGRVRRPDRVTVHRGARERRQVDAARRRPRRAPGRPRPRPRPARPRAAGRARARARAPPRSRAATPSAAYANARDLGRRPGAQRGAQRRAPARGARRRARAARRAVGGDLRRRRLDRRHVRRADAAARDARQRARRPAAAQLRQGGGARRPASSEARGDVVVTIDGDLQDDPAEIPRLLAKLDEGFDLVSGWKAKRRDPLTRRLPSRLFNAVTGPRLGAAPARLQLRPQGLPGRGRARPAPLRRAAPLHPGARPLPRLPRGGAARSTTGRASTAARATAWSGTCAGFLDLLTVTFMGRYRHRPLHLFGGARPAARRRRHGRARLPHGAEADRARRSATGRC